MRVDCGVCVCGIGVGVSLWCAWWVYRGVLEKGTNTEEMKMRGASGGYRYDSLLLEAPRAQLL